MAHNSTLVDNLEQQLKPVPNTAHLTPAISSSVFLGSSLSITSDVKYLFIQVETNNVRLTLNGTTPSATVGFQRRALWEGILSRSEFLASKWIRESGDAVLQIAQLR